MSAQRDVSRGASWAHALAIGTMQRHYASVECLHSSSAEDPDSYFVAVAEFVMWACVVDEGYDQILGDLTSPTGKTYRRLRDASPDGRTVIGARWARNHIVHCVANPVVDRAGNLGADFRLGESTLGPDFRWLPTADIVATSVNPQGRNRDGRRAYDALLAGRPVFLSLQSCMRWLSEVRYDYRDPGWAQRWFAAQP